MKLNPIPATLFARNRRKLAGLMNPGSLAVVGSARVVSRNGDQFYPYRQSSDFYYLTGINQEESTLVLYPDHPDTALREILFIKKPTPKTELWSGPLLDFRQASLLSGIKEVRWSEERDSLLLLIIPGASLIYADQREGIKRDQEFIPVSPLVTRLRMVKEMEEIEEIKRAAQITRSAFLRVLKMVKPGIWEYQVEAEIIHEFIAQGADGHAFEPIVASGKNALILHYIQNRNRCLAGDLILMDFGAEVNNYAADCSRTIPVSGYFSARQHQLYAAVLRVFKQALERMKAGMLMNDFHNDVGALWEEEHLQLGLYSTRDVKERANTEPLWKKYFMHGTSHSLGLDVHDPFNRLLPFEPGMVLTCEPAIYIPEEGIGIRLESDILITDHGPVDLLEDIPFEAAHIEELMGSNF